MSTYLGKRRDWDMYDSYARFRQRELDLEQKEIQEHEMQVKEKNSPGTKRRATQRTTKNNG